jgi:hypothetical protein
MIANVGTCFQLPNTFSENRVGTEQFVGFECFAPDYSFEPFCELSKGLRKKYAVRSVSMFTQATGYDFD